MRSRKDFQGTVAVGIVHNGHGAEPPSFGRFLASWLSGGLPVTEKEQLQAEMERIRKRIQEIDYNSRSTLGKNLLRLRTDRNMTQQELSEAIGCTRVTITNVERGTCDTTLARLMKLCDVLKVTPNDLLLESR